LLAANGFSVLSPGEKCAVKDLLEVLLCDCGALDVPARTDILGELHPLLGGNAFETAALHFGEMVLVTAQVQFGPHQEDWDVRAVLAELWDPLGSDIRKGHW